MNFGKTWSTIQRIAGWPFGLLEPCSVTFYTRQRIPKSVTFPNDTTPSAGLRSAGLHRVRNSFNCSHWSSRILQLGRRLLRVASTTSVWNLRHVDHLRLRQRSRWSHQRIPQLTELWQPLGLLSYIMYLLYSVLLVPSLASVKTDS